MLFYSLNSFLQTGYHNLEEYFGEPQHELCFIEDYRVLHYIIFLLAFHQEGVILLVLMAHIQLLLNAISILSFQT